MHTGGAIAARSVVVVGMVGVGEYVSGGEQHNSYEHNASKQSRQSD